MLQQLREWTGNLTIEKIGLGVAIGLLLATWWQGCLTRQALHVTERAYIDVHGIGLEPLAVVSVEKFTMVILVKNTGRTAATITDIDITPVFIPTRSRNTALAGKRISDSQRFRAILRKVTLSVPWGSCPLAKPTPKPAKPWV